MEIIVSASEHGWSGMRIVTYTKKYHPVIGGVETTSRNLCRGLVALGHSCRVVCLGESRSHDLVDGVPVDRLPQGMWHDGFKLSVLLEARRMDDADVVHIHSFYPFMCFEAALMCRARGIPFVFTPHYHGQGHSVIGRALFPLFKRLGGKALGWAGSVTVNSEYERDLLRKDFPMLDNVEVITPCVRSIELGGPRDRGRDLLFVGRLEEYKGAQHVIGAVAALRERGVRGRIVGHGGHREALEDLARDLDVEDRITFLDRLDDDALRTEYRNALALVLTSSAEAYGLVVAEALAQGTPAIVSGITALREFEGEPGCIVVDASSEGVTQAVDAILDEFPRVGPFSDKILGPEDWARRFEDVYRLIL